MSKKLASGSFSIVLDVKVGSGAFMKRIEEAKKLATLMISIGKSLGRRVSALITNMDVPLGRYVGNSLEVLEAISVLKGKGDNDIREISIEISSKMLSLVYGYDKNTAIALVTEAIKSGKAYEKFKEWILAQGADKEKVENESFLSFSNDKISVVSAQSGYISSMDTEKIGICACMAGAGRESKDDIIDLGAGIEILAKTGDYVEIGAPIATIYTNKPEKEKLKDAYLSALKFSKEKVEKPILIYDILD
jgi:pyrimidine-nucleoside phosphorylase